MEKLTTEQRTQWSRDGYLVLEQVLSSSEVTFYSGLLDTVRAKPGYEPMDHPMGHYEWLEHCEDLDADGFMDRRDLLSYDEAFIALIDRPGVFDLVVDIMGPYIGFSMSQAIVRPSGNFSGYTHTDGGESMAQLRVSETSRPVAMKAMYLLSDVSGPDSGNLTVFPGSHQRAFPIDREPPMNPYSPGATQLMGKAGDCYLFPHALWHGPAKNTSGRGRKTLLYNYCQMCVRAYDFAATPEVVETATSRQRRLLGDLGYDFRPGSYFYVPDDQVAIIYGETA